MNDTREDLDESDFEFILIEYNREALRFCFVFSISSYFVTESIDLYSLRRK